MMEQIGLQVTDSHKTPTATRVAPLVLFGIIALLTPTAKAEQTKTVFNPYTGKFDFITQLSTTSIAPGAGISVSTTSSGVTITANGVSNSTLTFVNIQDINNQVWALTVSTPGNLVTVTTTSSAGIGFNAVTVQTATITGISSGQCLQTGTGGLVTGTGSACGAGGGGGIVSPGTFTWTNNFGISMSTASIGGTFPILSTSTLQTGATFYVSSGTVGGNLVVGAGG